MRNVLIYGETIARTDAKPTTQSHALQRIINNSKR